MVDWHRVSPVQHVFHASPVIPPPYTTTLPPRNVSPCQLFPPTTPSQSPLRRALPHCNLNPADISPDIFAPTTSRPASLMVRNDLYAVVDLSLLFHLAFCNWYSTDRHRNIAFQMRVKF